MSLRVQVHAAIWVDHKLVVHRSMRHGHERITLPGGRVKPRESIEDCLLREVREEVHLDVAVGELLLAAEVLNTTLQDVVLVFGATIVGQVDHAKLQLVAPTSPQAGEILPPVLAALSSDALRGDGPAHWLGNLLRPRPASR